MSEKASDKPISSEPALISNAWRWFILAFAVLVTLFYLFGIFVYTGYSINDFRNLSLNEQGDFLAGVFSGLAFLWFVAALIYQAFELGQNSRALRMQAEELRRSVEHSAEQASSLDHSTHIQTMQLFIDCGEKYASKMSSILFSTMEKYCKSKIKEINKESITDEYGNFHLGDRQDEYFEMKRIHREIEEAWERYAQGDKDIFLRIFDEQFITGAQPVNNLCNVMRYLEGGPNYIANFVGVFEEYISIIDGLKLDPAYVERAQNKPAGRIYDVTSQALKLFYLNPQTERA